jgi:hypothetical protein
LRGHYLPPVPGARCAGRIATPRMPASFIGAIKGKPVRFDCEFSLRQRQPHWER